MEERHTPGETGNERESGPQEEELTRLRAVPPSVERLRRPWEEELLRDIKQEREKQATRRKWGQGMVILGAVTILDSCAFFPIPLVGPPAWWLGCALIVAGSVLMYRPPRMKHTNEALMIAAKYGNRLTVPRLAVEMDISLKKAESIMSELVKSGVAEIDLDEGGPDSALVYRIRGI